MKTLNDLRSIALSTPEASAGYEDEKSALEREMAAWKQQEKTESEQEETHALA